MELILHIGLSKTGTTAIQNFLYKNRKNLLKQGILYPETGLFKTPTVAAHYYVAWSIFKHPGVNISKIPTFKEILYSLEKELQENNPKKVIISSESFMHFRESHIKKLLKELQKLFSKIKIVGYFRRQDQWIESSYAQVLKTGEIKILPFELSINHALKHLNWLLKYDIFLTRWVNSSINSFELIPRIYDREILTNGDIIQDFLTLLEVNFSKLKFDDLYKNPSLDPINILTLLKLNNLYNLPQGIYLKISNFLLQLQKEKPHPLKTLMRLNRRKEIITYYESNNENFFRQWFNTNNLFELTNDEIRIYEEQDKLLKNKEKLDKDVKERYNLALEFLEKNFPEFKKYKKETALTTISITGSEPFGIVDKFSLEKVTGWVVDKASGKPQTVVLKVNDIPLLEKKAAEPREFLKEEYGIDFGGFTIYWKEIVLPNGLKNLPDNQTCEVKLVHKETGKVLQGNYRNLTVEELKKITRPAEWLPWVKINLSENVRSIIEFFSIDNLSINILQGVTLTIGGILLIKDFLNKDNFALYAIQNDKQYKANWDISSPGIYNQYKNNPNASKARFSVKLTSLNFPIKLVLVNRINNHTYNLAEILI